MRKVFIIILSFNGSNDLIECLGSLVKGEKGLEWLKINILVVDNKSNDGSVDKVRGFIGKHDLKKRVKIIENKKNLGFAAGNNVGIKYALRKGADSVLLLNQDTLVQKNFLEGLMKNGADIVAPVIRSKRGSDWIYDYGGRVNWWLGRPTHLEKRKLVEGSGSIDYVSGCAMLVKRQVFKKIGFLDERFFLYFEDADFCLRAAKAGFKIAVEPRSVITHKLKEKKKKPLKQHFSLLRSNLIFIWKHVPLLKKLFAGGYAGLLFLKIVWNQLR